MNVILRNLMATLLLIHASFGCCSLHAHDCSECIVPSVKPKCIESCCHCQQKPKKHDSHKSNPKPCKKDCDGTCTYLPSQRSKINASHWAVGLVFVIDTSKIDHCNGQHLLSCPWDRSGGQLLNSPPLRLHLLHQVILI